jgi:NADPH:quinone reductase-like Zn-dependent oxidoreductase
MKFFVLKAYGEPPQLEIKESSIPDLSEDDILVKVSYSAVNDYDWSLSTGKPLLYRLLFGLLKPKLRPGMEISGVVKQIGTKIQNFHVGDRVFGDLSEDRFGGFATHVLAKEKSLRKIPDELALDEAASLPHAGLLVHQSIELLNNKQCKKILINGAGGGVGTLAFQLLKNEGVRIDGIDTGEKLSDMDKLGYEKVYDYKVKDLQKLDEQYDFILDTKSKFWPWHYSSKLAKNGIFVTVGGDLPQLAALLIFKGLIKKLSQKELKILGLKANRGLEDFVKLYLKKSMKSRIDGPYPFDEAANALSRFGQGLHSGKVLLKIASESEH